MRSSEPVMGEEASRSSTPAPWEGTLTYLPLERSHIGPGVGGGVVAFHSAQVVVVVAARHGVDVPTHHTHAQVRVLLLQGLDLEPAVVPRVVPSGGQQGLCHVMTALRGVLTAPAPLALAWPGPHLTWTLPPAAPLLFLSQCMLTYTSARRLLTSLSAGTPAHMG